VQTVNNTLSKHLLLIKGFSDVKVEKIKEAAKKCLVRFQFVGPPL